VLNKHAYKLLQILTADRRGKRRGEGDCRCVVAALADREMSPMALAVRPTAGVWSHISIGQKRRTGKLKDKFMVYRGTGVGADCISRCEMGQVWGIMNELELAD
jgi:hypothetical protein